MIPDRVYDGQQMTELQIRRHQMLTLMSGWSEYYYSAGWLNGLDQIIRHEEKSNDLWLVMAAACEGWPMGYEAEDGWEPLSEEEADRAYELVRKVVR